MNTFFGKNGLNRIGGYCSRSTLPVNETDRIDESVSAMFEIIDKDLICRHDVKNLNQLYRQADSLEKRIQAIPRDNSSVVLGRLARKISTIVEEDAPTAIDLIKLHHLRSFADQELQIAKCFALVNAKFERTPSNLIALATHLPCCEKEAFFNQDVTALFGVNIPVDIRSILEEKRKKIKHYEETRAGVRTRKNELASKRLADPQPQENYPTYLDELLTHGYIHLYDHLLQMKSLPNRIERNQKVKTLSLSDAAHVLLETRDAIIAKVLKEIPASDSKVVLLVGGSGSGKSTAFCFLRGDKMEIKDSYNYKSLDDNEHLIGHQGATSRTLLPSVARLDDLALIDFPGFEDTHGELISLGIELALKALISHYHPAVVVLDAITNHHERYAAAAALGLRLGRMIDKKSLCILGVTKYLQQGDFSKKRRIEVQAREQFDQNQEAAKKKLRLKIDLLEKKLAESVAGADLQKVRELLVKTQNELLQSAGQPYVHQLSDEEQACSQRVLACENELKRQVGLDTLIKFDLLNPSQRSQIIAMLKAQFPSRSLSLNQLRKLQASDRKLIDDFFSGFKTNFSDKLAVITDFATFEREVLESSLLSRILTEDHQEIKDLFCLSEMDPQLAWEYDKDIVEHVFKDLMQYVLKDLNGALVDEIIKNAPIGTTELCNELQQRYKRLRDFVIGSQYGEVPSDNTKAEQKLNELRNSKIGVQAGVHTALLTGSVLLFLIGRPALTLIGFASMHVAGGIFGYLLGRQVNLNEIQTISDCIETLYLTFLNLERVRKTIEHRGKIDKLADKLQLNTANLGLVRETLAEVERIYDVAAWRNHVNFMHDRLLLRDMLANDDVLLTNLQHLLTYFFLESDAVVTEQTNTSGDVKCVEITASRVNDRLHFDRPLRLRERESRDGFIRAGFPVHFKLQDVLKKFELNNQELHQESPGCAKLAKVSALRRFLLVAALLQ